MVRRRTVKYEVTDSKTLQSFLEGLKATLMASKDFEDGHYKSTPERGLRAYGRVYAGWAYGQTVNNHNFNHLYLL